MTSPLHRTNLNLFTSDVAYLSSTLGHGWTERVRDIIHTWVLAAQSTCQACEGTGTYANLPCEFCHGSGRTRAPRKF